MKKQLKILNTREIKHIQELIHKQYSCKLETKYTYLKDQKNKIYIIHSDIAKIEFESLKINTIGLYFAEINKHGELRLTMEGSQLIGPTAKKNTIELNQEQIEQYFKGEEVEINKEIEDQPFLIITKNTDFFGAAKYKEGKLLNYLPKAHRTMELA
jgi:NOL1/NOP2/fmu family ribosome biogenesis protein